MGIYKLPPASGPLSSSLKWSLISFSLPVLSIPESLKESKVRTKFWKRKETEGEERRGRNVTESRLRGSQGPVDAPRPLASRPRTVPGPVPLRIPLGVPSCQGTVCAACLVREHSGLERLEGLLGEGTLVPTNLPGALLPTGRCWSAPSCLSRCRFTSASLLTPPGRRLPSSRASITLPAPPPRSVH